MIYTGQDELLLKWAENVLKVSFDPKQCSWITKVDENYDILAVVVYSRFSPWNCEMSIASQSPKWCSRGFLKAAFHFPFNQWNLRRITAAVEPDNRKSIDMLERLGFIREATLSEWFGDKDALIYRMTRKECKWLSPT